MNFLSFLTSGASRKIDIINLQSSATNAMPSSLVGNNDVSEHKVDNAKQAEWKPTNAVGSEKVGQLLIPEIVSRNANQILNQQQQLINQYMHLNLQLMSQKIEALEHISDHKHQESDASLGVRNHKKKIKKNNTCGHQDKQHYAKGMCNNCYHKYGRTKKPWNCNHDKLYASGMCQNCYISKYNKKKKEQHFENTQIKEEQI